MQGLQLTAYAAPIEISAIVFLSKTLMVLPPWIEKFSVGIRDSSHRRL
jgi:hypothetical protein